MMKNKLPSESPTNATTIRYSDHPSTFCSKIQELSITQFIEKIQKRFEYFDEVLDLNNRLAGQTISNSNENYTSIVDRFLQLGLTDTQSFVVCNMGAVGHGLFADRDFGPAECFILYAGNILSKSAISSDYALDFDQNLDSCIDSSQAGNLARFIQHLPLNFTDYTPKYYPGPHLEITDKLFWEYRNLVCKNNLKTTDIAWSNLACFSVAIKGKIYPVIYNIKAIKRGEQLGMSYGIGYWIQRGKCPTLFTTQGETVPSRDYQFKEAIIELPPVPVVQRNMPSRNLGYIRGYTKDEYLADTIRSMDELAPMYFHHLCNPVSRYDLRDLLTEFHVLEEEYLPLQSHFVLRLSTLLGSDYRISLYPRDPQASSQSGILDLVIRTDDLMKWAQLAALLKGPICNKINVPNKCFKTTQEVIFLDVQNEVIQEVIFQLLSRAKELNVFTTPLKPEFIPQGPQRNDPNNLWLPSGKVLAEIIRHNPGLTEEEIQRDFDNVSKPQNVNSVLDQLKSNMLSEFTVGFFNKKPLIDWKVYPEKQLPKRYQGHSVRFYNIPAMHSAQADTLKSKLVKAGYHTELVSVGEKKSLVVDLSTSTPKI